MNPLTKTAATLILAAALLHLSLPLLSGIVSTSLLQLALAALYLVLGVMVFKNKRWAMWLSFFAMLFSGIAGMAGYMGGSVTPAWFSLCVCVVSWVAAACLFVVLWRDHVLETHRV